MKLKTITILLNLLILNTITTGSAFEGAPIPVGDQKTLPEGIQDALPDIKTQANIDYENLIKFDIAAQTGSAHEEYKFFKIESYQKIRNSSDSWFLVYHFASVASHN